MTSVSRRIEFNDEDLARRVESYLARKQFPGLQDWQVEACDGVIVVSGQVDSGYQHDIVVNSCRRVAGVIDLVDRIEVLHADHMSRTV